VNNRPLETPQHRTIQVEVRKKRTFIQGEAPPRPQADPTHTPAGQPEPSLTDRVAAPQPEPVIDNSSHEEIAAFKPLEEVPYEPEPWQVVGLLKKTGVVVLVTPPGSCSFALSAYFASHLSGRVSLPFGLARYPGDVLFSTHTPHLVRALRAVASSAFIGNKQILIQQTPRRFDWKAPGATFERALKDRAPGTTAAVIIDAGPPPHRFDESKIEAAYVALSGLAHERDCLILLIVEHTSKNPDPFEQVPRALKAFRGTLLTVPLRSKALAPQPYAPAEFLFLRLAEATPNALTARFTLWPVSDLVETTGISWGEITYGDPRKAFRTAETVDLSVAQRAAVQLAVEVIQQRGPTSSRDLQAVGRATSGIAPTTMRDALSVAKLLGHLDTVRSLDGKSYWIIPGTNWMYPPHALTDRQIPF